MTDGAVSRQVAANVRTLRAQRRWTQQRLAEACARAEPDIPLTRGTIAKIEAGSRKYVTAGELLILAQALEVSPNALFKETPEMSRYQVQAEFVSQDQPTAQQLAELCRLLSIHAGDVFGRSAGWRATVFVAMSPSPADAGFDAGEIMRAANETAGMPPARMTDMHVYRIGGVPMPPADGEGQ